MPTDEKLIERAKALIESRTGWGNSHEWTNQDFVALSEKIREKTGETLSHVTLKRIWGKVKYDSLPNTHTLNTLVQFIDYENWREFKIKEGNGDQASHPADPYEHTAPPAASHQQASSPMASHQEVSPIAASYQEAPPPASPPIQQSNRRRYFIWTAITLVALAGVSLFIRANRNPPGRPVYTFTSKKTVSQGVPNSVIFDFDASGSPYDSVIIQQSWDTTLRTKLSKGQHHHTSIYYYPDFLYAKLIVGGRIVGEHSLFIQSNGWLPMIEHEPVPVYFTKEDAIGKGKMSLTAAQIESRNIPMQPSPPTTLFTNVRDFGEIYSDDFVFETSLKNDYRLGAAACQLARVYLLCEGTAIWVPLCAKGCVSAIDMYFTGFYASGQREDLSAFGVDFSNYIKLRIESHGGIGKVFVNDHLAYQVNSHVSRSRIIGIDYRFEGTGSVDYVKLSNGKVNYEDQF
jgi:hypothetical protein